jgi:hypothetical protein
MSRSGYTDDCGDDDPLAMGRWRGAVNSAIRGKRGQQTLSEILAALDAMPVKALAAESLVTEEGEFCTLGVLGAQRGIALDKLDPEDPDGVAEAFGIAPAMVREIVYMNDEQIDGYEWRHVEICGPVRPNWPEWGSHTKSVRVELNDAPARRWKYMRKWVADHLKQPNVGIEPHLPAKEHR